MHVLLDGERQIRVQVAGEGLKIEPTAEGIQFSPLHMLAASLATCTISVLAAWAMQVGVPIDDLEIGLQWEYVEDPYRVGSYLLTIRWPDLPGERRAAVLRVARHCTVERTLQIPPVIETGLEGAA